MNRTLIFFAVLIFFYACSKDPIVDLDNIDESLEQIAPAEQRQGNPVLGKEYLLYLDYVDSGLPLSIFNSTVGLTFEKNNVLNRVGDNADIPYSYTAVDAANGVRIVAPNCMQCHAGYINGEFVLGLGNTSFDFTQDQTPFTAITDLLVEDAFTRDSPEWSAYSIFARAIKASAQYLVTETVGSNPADKLAFVLAAHRDIEDLSWIDAPSWSIPEEVIPADVPAWWLLKKKNAMFSTGIGRGDFARIMMASSVLTLQDTTKAREVDNKFADVLSFINSLEAPKYPSAIDMDKAQKGETIFLDNCAKCHGTYGASESYPNLLVNHKVIQTDAALASSNYAYAEFSSWYNNSWFAKEPYAAYVEATNGYIAPPLDGVWATAPYLHNGSVPTIKALLQSRDRPQYWDRPLTTETYDLNDMGVDYIEQTEKVSNYTYDTTLEGYGNEGHYFGDHLSGKQRGQLIEYLKTL